MVDCPHLGTLVLSPPTPAQSVYREDCTQCFDSIDDPEGLDVCLQCFNGGCAGENHHGKLHSTTFKHPLALNIRRTRKRVVRDEPPLKISKLAIAAETEADRFDTTTFVRCDDCGLDNIESTDPKVAKIVEGIMTANTFSRKEEVKAWEQELTSCEHILTLQQQDPRKIESQDLGHCSMCDLKENLWLCLECGNLGCGRKQKGGAEGHGHGLAHTTASGHGVAVKLGSITPGGTADVYCYSCDEERVDEDLSTHLANWGILLAEQQKTEKSLTEMQIEQNLRWEFSMTTEDGKELKPVFGPGLTGLKNLGNSCYLASIVQCLFDLPAFKQRYYQPGEDLPGAQDPAADLETQLRKTAEGLLSGRYSKPDADIKSTGSSSPGTDDQQPAHHQKGLAPAMLKHLIGRGHAEFSTMRQQDAFELLQHIVKLVTRSQHPSPELDPTRQFRFVLEQRLMCLSCDRVRYSTTEQDSIFIDVSLEKLPQEEGEESGPPKYKPVLLTTCLDDFTAPETVELTCSACGSKAGFSKQSLFKTFPETLIVNARKMAVVNWVPIKVDVPVIVPDGPLDLSAYISKGKQPDEELLPEDVVNAAPAFVPNADALASLEGMGFPRVRCERALHATGNASDATPAMEWLFEHMEDADIDTPLDLGGSGDKAAASTAFVEDPGSMEMLAAMGFGAPQARKALKETDGDVERAVEWLFNHPDDQGDFGSGEPDVAPAARPAEKDVPGSSELPAKFELQSIVCHKGTSIHAGHYVAFIRKDLKGDGTRSWVLFNDEKVVEVVDVEEMKKFAYVYFFRRV